jgi:hypothetical protein
LPQCAKRGCERSLPPSDFSIFLVGNLSLSLSPSRPEFLPTGQGLAAREIAVDLALVRPAHENTLPHRAHIGQGFLYVKVDTGVVLNFPDWKSGPI